MSRPLKKAMTLTLSGLLVIFGLTACSLIQSQPTNEPCRLPDRPEIAEENIVRTEIAGDTWVSYRQDAHERVLVYIQELENVAKQCGGVR